MDKKYYYESNIDLTSLQSWEKEVVETLKQVVSIVADIYSLQKNPDHLGANFYPYDATAAHIEKAGSANKDILSAYTIIKRDDMGEFVAVPYSEEYKDQINQVSDLLSKASQIYASNGYPKYAKYLTVVASDLKSNNYDQSFVEWLTNDEDVNIDILLGPLETYQDKLLAVKRAFQANLRIKDNTEFEKLTNYIRVISAIQPASPFVADNSDLRLKLTVRVDNVIATGGWHAELMVVGSNYPNDPRLFKHGIKVLIYLNNLYSRYSKMPHVAREIFTEKALEGFDEKRFVENIARFITFHEIAEVISKVRYNYYKGKLKHLSDVFRELNSDLTAIKSASIHVLDGLMNPEDYKDIVLAAICSGLRSFHITRGKISGVKVYADGYIFALDYLMKEGGLKITEDGKFDVDFPVLYSSIANLTTKFNTMMMEGNFEEASRLFTNYNAENSLIRFEDKLTKILG